MKIKLVYLSLLIFVAFFSCENEPVEDTLLNDNVGDNPAMTCEEATQVATGASLVLANATNETYATLCNDLAVALQAQINACGDTGGVLQTTLDNLDCSSNSNDNCDNAILLAQLAESALANASTENYTSLCNSYMTALQVQINSCGDSDGSIQAIIDGLDCEINSYLVLPRQIIETYEDGSTITIDFTFEGNKLIKDEVTYSYINEPSETDIYDYIYDNDLLVRVNNSFTGPSGNNDSDYSVFEYNSNNQLISETIYFTENGQVINTQIDTYVHNSDGTITFTEGGEEIYILSFVNGNLVTSEHINGENDYSYTYDNKNAVAKNIYTREVIGLFSPESGINNLMISVNTGGATDTDNLNISYTYNSDNFPATSTTIVNQGTSEEETYTTEYFYY